MYVGSVGGSNGDCIVKATVAELNKIYDSVGFPPFFNWGGGVCSSLMACVANKTLLYPLLYVGSARDPWIFPSGV